MKRERNFPVKTAPIKKIKTTQCVQADKQKLSILDFIIPKKNIDNSDLGAGDFLQLSVIKYKSTVETERKIARLSDCILTLDGQAQYIKNNNQFEFKIGSCVSENYLHTYRSTIKPFKSEKTDNICKEQIKTSGIVVDAQNLMFSALTSDDPLMYKKSDANEKATLCFIAFEKAINKFVGKKSNVGITYVFKDFPITSKLSVNKISDLMKIKSQNSISIVKYENSSKNIKDTNGDDILALYLASYTNSVLFTKDRISKDEDKTLITNNSLLYYKLLHGKDLLQCALGNRHKDEIMKCIRC